jgi:type IV pilus assembly protein PilQ
MSLRTAVLPLFSIFVAAPLAWAQEAAPGLPSPAPTQEAAEDTSKLDVHVHRFQDVDVHARDASLTEALELLAIQAQRNIVLSAGVERTFSASFRAVPFEDALSALLEPNGLGYVVDGPLIVVMTVKEMKAAGVGDYERVSKMIIVDYHPSEGAAFFVKAMLSPEGIVEYTKDGGGVSSMDEPSSGGDSSSSGGDSTQSGSGEGSPPGDDTDAYSPNSDPYALRNAIIVHDYARNVAEIEAFLKEIDKRPQQILIEVSVIQTSLTEETAFGVDFAVLGSEADFTDFMQAPIGGNPLDWLSQDAAGDPITSPPGGEGFGLSGVGNTQNAGGFHAGYVGNTSVFLRALDSVTDVNILSNPKVLTLNRQRSKIHVGKKVGYETTAFSATGTSTSIQFIDSGIMLDLRPFILADGRVRLELSPSVSEVTFRQTSDGNQIPDTTIQSIQTDILLPPGYTAVIGGLFTDQMTRSKSQVPLLGDLPILGPLFQGRNDTVDETEIVFLVKPTIFDDDQVQAMGEDALRTGRSSYFGARRGLLMWSRLRRSARINLLAQQQLAEGDLYAARWNLRRSLGMNPFQPEILDAIEELDGGSSIEGDSILERLIGVEFEAHQAGGSGDE